MNISIPRILCKNLPILLVVLGCWNLSAQNHRIEELRAQLDQQAADSSTVIQLNELSWEFTRVNLDSSLHYATTAIQLSKELDYDAGISRALNLQAIYYSSRGNELRAKELNEEALEYARKSKHERWESAALNDLAIYYSKLGAYEMAIDYGEQAAAYKDNDYRVYSYNNLAIYYREVGDTTKAKAYRKRCWKEALLSKDTTIRAYGHQHLALQLIRENELDSAQYHLNISGSLYQTIGHIPEYTSNIFFVGYIKYMGEDKRASLPYFEKAIGLLEEHNYVNSLAFRYLWLVDYHLEFENYDQAKDYALKGYQICQESNLPVYAMDYQQYLTQIAKGEGNYEQALVYQSEYTQLKDSLFNQEQQQKILDIVESYEVQKRETENLALRAEQESAELILQNQRLLILVGSLAFMIVSLFAGFLFYSNRKKKEYSTNLEEEVANKTEKLKGLVKQLKTSNEELERFNYIASHDLKEPIRNIAMFSGLINKELGNRKNAKLEEYISYVSSNAKHLYFLIEDILEYARLGYQDVDISTQVNVKDQVNRIENLLRTGDGLSDAEIHCEEIPLIFTDRTKLFLVLKNLIENGLKYNESPTRKVWITYDRQGDMHQINVRDNGIGIDPVYFEQIFDMFKRLHNRVLYQGSGVGLAICQKIASQLGGSISVKSSDQGSIFSFSFPVSAKDRATDQPLEMVDAN